MTTKKTTDDAEVVDLSVFDTWTDEQEEAALAMAANAFQVRHVIKGDEAWFLAPRGVIYKLPLALTLKDYQRLSSVDNAESIEGVRELLRTFMGDAAADKLDDEPAQVAINILLDYGELMTRTQGVPLGKSSASSN